MIIVFISGAAPEPYLRGGGGASYIFTKSYDKKKTTIFTTQIQIVFF
jgi:hypothetical protein